MCIAITFIITFIIFNEEYYKYGIMITIIMGIAMFINWAFNELEL
jgi:hypothetical protein